MFISFQYSVSFIVTLGGAPPRGGDALRHRLPTLDIRRLGACPRNHDHLLAVHRYLAVVALQVRCTRLHEMAVGIDEICWLPLIGVPSGFMATPLLGITSIAKGSRLGSSAPAFLYSLDYFLHGRLGLLS